MLKGSSALVEKHTLTVESVDDVPVIRAVGELDSTTVPEMRAVVAEVSERRPRVLVFDLRKISYMDSSGLGILVSAKKRLGANGGEVVLITDQPAVLKALSLTGLDQIFRIYPSEGWMDGCRRSYYALGGDATMPRKIQRYGWIPDHPDHRDYLYSAPTAVLRSLPAWVDLRPACPPIYNQGHLGSCTANAIAAAIQFDQMKQRRVPAFTASRLFIYYNGRAAAGAVDCDSGASIRDAVKSVTRLGACPEVIWPYVPAAFRTRPSEIAYQVASQHKAVIYQRLAQDLNQMKGCLASGYPFAFGFAVYESFGRPQVASTGHAPMPAPGEAVVYRHAVLAVGYDDARQWFLARNSWGPGWGLDGYFTLPYAYLTQEGLAGDPWTIQVVQ